MKTFAHFINFFMALLGSFHIIIFDLCQNLHFLNVFFLSIYKVYPSGGPHSLVKSSVFDNNQLNSNYALFKGGTWLRRKADRPSLV